MGPVQLRKRTRAPRGRTALPSPLSTAGTGLRDFLNQASPQWTRHLSFTIQTPNPSIPRTNSIISITKIGNEPAENPFPGRSILVPTDVQRVMKILMNELPSILTMNSTHRQLKVHGEIEAFISVAVTIYDRYLFEFGQSMRNLEQRSTPVAIQKDESNPPGGR